MKVKGLIGLIDKSKSKVQAQLSTKTPRDQSKMGKSIFGVGLYLIFRVTIVTGSYTIETGSDIIETGSTRKMILRHRLQVLLRQS